MYAIVGQPLGVFKAEAVERDPQGRIVADANTGLPVAAAKAKKDPRAPVRGL